MPCCPTVPQLSRKAVVNQRVDIPYRRRPHRAAFNLRRRRSPPRNKFSRWNEAVYAVPATTSIEASSQISLQQVPSLLL